MRECLAAKQGARIISQAVQGERASARKIVEVRPRWVRKDLTLVDEDPLDGNQRAELMEDPTAICDSEILQRCLASFTALAN